MTDEKDFADGLSDHATDGDSPRARQAPERRWTDAMKPSWPALVVPSIPIPRPDSAPESCARRRR
jgi:hypothetical protein